MNTKFKPGTLVMLIHLEDPLDGAPPIGAIGEVKDIIGDSLLEIKVGEVLVNFPKHRSDTKFGGWYIPTSWLIPLNDGNLADDETYDVAPIKEKEIV